MKTAILPPVISLSAHSRALFVLLCAVVMTLSATPKAFAQAPGFPDILDDIFGGNTQQQQGNPYGQTPAGLVYIENIPIQVGFDSRGGALSPEAVLIVTAIAPPPPNVRRASPLVMGETRLLISRLTSPLQMVVAVPSDMAREVDYARIEARIVDINGVETHRLQDNIQYSGGQPPFLNLIAVNSSGGAAPVYTPPAPQSPNQPYSPPSGANISGTVSIPAGTEPKRGASLVLELRENGLAGGTSGNIVQTKRIDIDQIAPPYEFALPLPADSNSLESPDLTIWIEDWAGRKTHVLARPVPVEKTLTPIHITLDAMVTGQDAADPTRQYVPPAGVTRTIAGEAQFDAFKGLPAGSILTVRLRNGERLDETLASKDISLDGLSGYVRYSLPVELMTIQGRRAAPLIDAVLTDNNGRTLFTTRQLVTLPKSDNGPINIQMQPTANY